MAADSLSTGIVRRESPEKVRDEPHRGAGLRDVGPVMTKLMLQCLTSISMGHATAAGIRTSKVFESSEFRKNRQINAVEKSQWAMKDGNE
jgi:hypothetical protein